jgi:LPXTG-motif cell wall-anchored protein
MKISKNFWLSISFVACALAASPGYAAKFANQFIEFELPAQWQCNLEGAEWVCQSTDEKKKKDAIIVLAAKIAGPQDSMDQYLTYLKSAKSYNSIQGKPVKSDPKYAKNFVINGQTWVDALHLESEIPGFYTRYLATIKEDIGVLVTYSINKAKYQSYIEDFDNLARTLKVFRKPGAGLNAGGPANGNIFGQAAIPPAAVDQSVVFGAPQGGSDQTAAKPKQADNSLMLIGLLVLVVGYVIWRRKKNQG